MTSKQIKYLMNGKTVDDIDFISFTATCKIIRERYATIVFNHDTELVECTAKNGRQEYWDFVDVNGIVMKQANKNSDMDHIQKLTGPSLV